MKVITAIIRPHMVSHVLHALERCEHFPGVTISKCQGESRGRGAGGTYRAERVLSLHEMARLEIYCGDAHWEHLVDEIKKSAHTNNPGDGVIAIADLVDVARIRSGERGDAAV